MHEQRNRVGSCPIPDQTRYYSKREADANASRGYAVYQCGMHFHLAKLNTAARQAKPQSDQMELDLGVCGMHYTGQNQKLRGASCVLDANHYGRPHKSAQGRYWATEGYA